jgi:hypothetical protein
MSSISELTAWLREERDLTAARLAWLIREKGVDPKTLICAKVSPDIKDPTSGIVVTPQGQVFQFSFNRAGMLTEMGTLDSWINITSTYTNHPWRDDILAALALV